ncbi:MAG: bifunctional folylpolyglutamate synthase/dihydrofolate synthase [Actinobacteria bacterium]|nr:bifunctional folylpolyglutamate synthase/dihydrofolate synthase [Actinomycetota bacterium]MCA1722273.1 bifunctional folylpolyglutamate synthase/dihydrofolate synthase [Actinomycetota bacterium]
MTALAPRFPAENHMEPDLERIRLLVDVLGGPHKSYPVIAITGTNGKSSTARIIDQLLQSFGLRVGRFTSPHLESVTERITIDGVPLSEERFAEVYDEIEPYVELVDSRMPVPTTFFEVLTGMAFAAFADAPVDVAVMEVGLGGLWDATNVAEAATSVVLPVGLDHVPLLGTTVAEVATEKAGIIHPGAQVVLAAQVPEAAEVLLRRVAEVGATVAREGLEFGVVSRLPAVGGQLVTLQGLAGTYDEMFLPLFGEHQAQNAACAVAAVEAFLGGGETRQIDADAVREGLAAARSPGRLEVVRTSPTVVLDAGHNPHGMAATVRALADSFSFTRLVGVVACLSDKDVRGMLEVLEPALTAIVVTTNASPRALPVDDLYALAVDVFGEDRVYAEDRLDDALDTAVQQAEDEVEYGGAGVLVTGSVVTVGEARVLLTSR